MFSVASSAVQGERKHLCLRRGPRAPGWTGTSTKVRHVAEVGIRFTRHRPPRQSRADQAERVKVVRPVGRSTLPRSAWPAPRRVGRRRRDEPTDNGLCSRKMSTEPVAQQPHRLTDLLTRPGGTGETTRETGDSCGTNHPVSETRQNAGDEQDARRTAHNPEVAGSNPAPATRQDGSLEMTWRAVFVPPVTRSVTITPATAGGSAIRQRRTPRTAHRRAGCRSTRLRIARTSTHPRRITPATVSAACRSWPPEGSLVRRFPCRADETALGDLRARQGNE
jgi:hypothetical protein